MDSAHADKGVTEASSASLFEVHSGHVGQVAHLKERFNVWSTVGILFSVTNTPVVLGTFLATVVGVGGSPVFIWGYIMGFALNMCICTSLAEIAAVYPHASGQIYWTAMLAPPKYSRFLSYLVGWYAAGAWFFWFCGTNLLVSYLFFATGMIHDPNLDVQTWQIYLGYLACAVIALLWNWPLIGTLPYILKVMVAIINAAALYLFVSLLVRSHPKQSAHTVFIDIVNETGWASDGLVFCLGLLPGVTAVNGFDAPSHMSEEMPNPSKQVPQVMIGASLLSGSLGVPMIIVYMFCVTKPENLLAPIGGQPIVQLFVDSYRSYPLAVIASLYCALSLTVTAICDLTTFSRLWWAMARQRGVPLPKPISRVHQGWKLPVNAIIFGFIASCLIGLIQLGSTVALNALFAAAILFILTSYATPIALMLYRRKELPSERYCNLKGYGPVLNIISLTWIAFIFIWLCFPNYLPVTPQNMNYAILVFGATTILCSANWYIHSMKVYKTLTADDRLSYE
ncbi:Choline transport protein [Exophiala dermatitidis]